MAKSKRQQQAMMGKLIDEAGAGGAYTYRATVFLVEDMLRVLKKVMQGDTDQLSVPEQTVLVGMGEMRTAMHKGKGPMCGCCDYVFTMENEPPMAFVLLQAEAFEATVGSLTAVCELCVYKPDMVLSIVRRLQPDARIVNNTVGNC